MSEFSGSSGSEGIHPVDPPASKRIKSITDVATQVTTADGGGGRGRSQQDLCGAAAAARECRVRAWADGGSRPIASGQPCRVWPAALKQLLMSQLSVDVTACLLVLQPCMPAAGLLPCAASHG
eukprot:357488-Chlamydomonas_euryale.AAC.1